MDVSRETYEARFWAKIDKRAPDECWLWKGALRNGRGTFRVAAGFRYAHQIAYEIASGPVPDGMKLFHTCDGGTLCCNDAHMRPMSQRDGLAAKKVVAEIPLMIAPPRSPYEVHTEDWPEPDADAQLCAHGVAIVGQSPSNRRFNELRSISPICHDCMKGVASREDAKRRSATIRRYADASRYLKPHSDSVFQ
ncbi:MAG: hypothetical protein H0X25_13810 [Acidobacteriales bacterium]|nr:hypothetical protein [Terriglobales bacterium]